MDSNCTDDNIKATGNNLGTEGGRYILTEGKEQSKERGWIPMNMIFCWCNSQLHKCLIAVVLMPTGLEKNYTVKGYKWRHKIGVDS